MPTSIWHPGAYVAPGTPAETIGTFGHADEMWFWRWICQLCQKYGQVFCENINDAQKLADRHNKHKHPALVGWRREGQSPYLDERGRGHEA